MQDLLRVARRNPVTAEKTLASYRARREFASVKTIALVALVTYLVAESFHVGYTMHFLPLRDATDADTPVILLLASFALAVLYVLAIAPYHVRGGDFALDAARARFATLTRSQARALVIVVAAMYAIGSVALGIAIPFGVGGFAAALNGTYEVVDFTPSQVDAIGLHEGIIVARQDHGALARVMPYDRTTNTVYTNVRMFDDLRLLPVQIHTDALGQHVTLNSEHAMPVDAPSATPSPDASSLPSPSPSDSP